MRSWAQLGPTKAPDCSRDSQGGEVTRAYSNTIPPWAWSWEERRNPTLKNKVRDNLLRHSMIGLLESQHKLTVSGKGRVSCVGKDEEEEGHSRT